MNQKARQAILGELRRLSDTGKLTPAQVVEEARHETNPMHSYFEWDDSKAAERYRLQQARTLISGFTTTVKVNHVEFDVQEFVEDPRKPENEQGYVPFETIRNSDDLKRTFMARELGIASTHVTKTREYAGALGLLPEVEKVQQDLYDLRRKAEGEQTTQ